MTVYRAKERIYVSRGVLAYNVGDVVPESAISNLHCRDKVAGEDTKAVKEAVAKATGQTAEETDKA